MAYDVKSIQKLDFFSAVRKYPGMYIGSKDADGLHHLAKEIISNSVDEYLNSKACDRIEITLHKDETLEIEDNGRGIPIGNKTEDVTALQLCFTEEHAGGKFLNATGESGYNSAGGMHGLGTKCVNALSDIMSVVSWNGGKMEKIVFKNGNMISHNISEDKENRHGLNVRFKPSLKYLETNTFEIKRLKDLAREESFLSKGLTVIVNDESDKSSETFVSQYGLEDYLDYLRGSRDNITSNFYIDESEGSFKLEAAFTYISAYSSEIKLYTNNIPQEKGTHLTGFKSALTSSLNAFAREKKWLKDKDENLSGADYEEGLVLVINFKMIDPVFKGQNKEELSSSEGRTYVSKFVSAALEDIFNKNEKEIKAIFDKAIAARKARDAAKKARDKAREDKPQKGLKAKMALSDKFIDCESKDPAKRNLMLVEGLSAAGSTLEARNVETDCIYMLRGKVISPLKQSIEKILANQEMSDIVKVIGAGFGDKFNVDKMNFDKIIITVDSDSDGYDIELLLITFFFTYMRPLVMAGKLYKAVTPLYIATTKKDKYYFYTEQELAEWKATTNEKYDLMHCKGLGEVSAEVLKEICFEKQRYKRIVVNDVAGTEALFNELEGKDVNPRKQYIYNNAERLGFNFV